jgi:hypothetical protein
MGALSQHASQKKGGPQEKRSSNSKDANADEAEKKRALKDQKRAFK